MSGFAIEASFPLKIGRGSLPWGGKIAISVAHRIKDDSPKFIACLSEGEIPNFYEGDFFSAATAPEEGKEGKSFSLPFTLCLRLIWDIGGKW